MRKICDTHYISILLHWEREKEIDDNLQTGNGKWQQKKKKTTTNATFCNLYTFSVKLDDLYL